MQTTTTCGSQVRLECRQGYAVSGYQTLTCMESGQWNHPPPTCERMLILSLTTDTMCDTPTPLSLSLSVSPSLPPLPQQSSVNFQP